MTISKPAPPLATANEPSVEDVLRNADVSFSSQQFRESLQSLIRRAGTVDMPAQDRAFWSAHSGIRAAIPAEASSVSSQNAAARVVMDASGLSADEVAKRLNLKASTVRHYKANRKLYSYSVGGRLIFPEWQFTPNGAVVPGLDKVLPVICDGAHPQTVAGFFLTPQPEFILRGKAQTPRQWLVEGGPTDPVVELARGISSII